MFQILKKEVLNSTIIRLSILAPHIANKAKPGQFIILRVDNDGERLPFTIAGTSIEDGSVDIIYQIVGASTLKLSQLNEGDYVADFVGPLGKASELDGLNKVCVIGGGAGCAIALPLAQALHDKKADVTSICGFRGKDLVILEKEFTNCSNKFIKMSDDGTWGTKGLVTQALREEILSGEKYDEVIAIGPLIMMKFVCQVTKEFNIKTIVSMNPIMIDGTGMCGCCRIFVGGKLKFACVDGPDFDGHEVDFDSAMERGTTYRAFERHKYEEECNLLKKEVK